MKFVYKYRALILSLTFIFLTNLLSIYFITSGIIMIPNTVVLENPNQQFLVGLRKLNSLNLFLNKAYIGEVDNNELSESLIDTMFDRLGDKYTDYYNSDEYKELSQDMTGRFGGIGVVIDGNRVITDTMDDSPAAQAGVQAGDVIVGVDGIDLTDKSLDEVVDMTRGDVGTDLTLKVKRGEEELEFTLTRKIIKSPSVETGRIGEDGYIKISSFDSDTAADFRSALSELKDTTGLVIDLRDNPGGLVDQAVAVADELMDEGTVVYSQNKNGTRHDYTTQDGKVDKPFVVLINESSASASEILSGALLKEGVPVIGEKSYGKGVMQIVLPVLDGTGFKVTYQEYFLKDGQKVNGLGITPSEEVVLDPNTLRKENDIVRDNQLDRSIEVLDMLK